MSNPVNRFYEFGGFRLEVTERRLLRAGAPVKLSPKEFDLLVMLVEHAGRALKKEELLSQLWPDVVVDEGTLTRNMSRLRTALGETREGEKFIETPPPKNESLAKIVPFTGLAGRENHPTFSPDGKQLAFTWRPDGSDNLDIYINLIGAGEPLRLTQDPAADVFPAWSPDGRFISSLPECGRGRTSSHRKRPSDRE